MDNLNEFIASRRQRLGDPSIPEGADKWGLALSGGGIRSATFSLGIMKALAQRKLLLRFDLLSTVSGGSYIGATIGRLFDRTTDAAGVKAVQDGLANANSSWMLWWLRANGRYLVPSGVLDKTLAIALYLRNLIAIHFELSLMAVIVGSFLALLNITVWGMLAWQGFVSSSAFFGWPLRFLSPWLPVAWVLLPILGFVGLVQCAEFWCLNWVRQGHFAKIYASVAILFLLALWVFASFQEMASQEGPFARMAFWIAALTLTLAWLLAAPFAYFRLPAAPDNSDAMTRARTSARSKLTQHLATVFRWAAGILVLGLTERTAWFVAFEQQSVQLVNVGLVLAITAAVLRVALSHASALVPGRSGLGTLLAIGRIAGYALMFALAVVWGAAVYRAVLGAMFVYRALAPFDAVFMAMVILLPSLLYVYLTRRNIEFLNLSSLHAFYRARLVRSYLGAANPSRFHIQAPEGTLSKVPPSLAARKVSDVEEVDADDDVSFLEYKPMRHGGPVHLINACINQTRDPRGGIFNQDRRGMLLTLASGGWMRTSVEAWEPMTSSQPLTLGTFTAISGAAVAPGLGALTRDGISALAMFAGVRLGYWWSRERRTGTPTKWQLGTAKLRRLMNETLGNFQGGRDDDWFLTDGGHFDNTGAYSLLAERCKVIVMSDAAADPDYAFSDLENLVRKARIDLDAEITFMRPLLDTHACMAGCMDLNNFGTLNDLASTQSTACMALATVQYAQDPENPGILIYIKPNLCAGLPVDLVNFKAANPAFPQETTADQFFSEAQWESYFLLGQELAQPLTRQFFDEMRRSVHCYFARDDETTLAQALTRENGASVHDAAQAPAPASDAPATALTSRIPARITITKTAVGATIGFSAVAAVGVSVWQAIDSWRTAQSKQTENERKALASLATLWAKSSVSYQAPKPIEGPEKAQELSDLASALLETADTLCPAGDADWFLKSGLASQILWDTVGQCNLLPRPHRPHACEVLVESTDKDLQPSIKNCLAATAQARQAEPPPNYWGFNYTLAAPLVQLHPCDPLRQAIGAAQAKFESLQAGTTSTAQADVETLKKTCSSDPWKDALPKPDQWLSRVALFDQAKAQVLRVAAEGSRLFRNWDDVVVSMASRNEASITQPSTQPRPPAPPPITTPEPPLSPTNGQTSSTDAPPKPSAFDLAAAQQACKGMTIYIQVYDESSREVARKYREPWRALNASVPPIENVSTTARTAGRSPPIPVSQPTVRYHRDDSKACAEQLAPQLSESMQSPMPWPAPEALSPALRSAPRTIEVWLAPTTATPSK